MTLEQNITAILESCFSGFKDELIEACAKRIMEQIEGQADTPQTDIHGLTDCDFCKGENCEDCEGGKDEPQTAQKVAELQKMCGIEIDPDRIRQTDCGWK